MDIIKDVIVPLSILGLSIGFTVWREQKIKASKKTDLFIQQAENWVKNIITLCQESEFYPYAKNISELVDDINRIGLEGELLLSVKGINKKIRKSIAHTMDSCSVFSTFPEDNPTEKQRDLIKSYCNGVRIDISKLQYK